MRYSELRERGDYKGPIKHETEYKNLFHLMGPDSFTHNIKTNTLSTRSYGYISTTYDVTMNNVVGKQAYAYKFILDAPKLAKDYGLFEYRAWQNTIGYNGQIDGGDYMDEKEFGVNTKSISPLTDYLKGIILNNPNGRLNSETFLHIHFRSYYYKEDTENPVEALKIAREEYNIPLFIQVGDNVRKISSKEEDYLSFITQTASTSDSLEDLVFNVAKRYKIHRNTGNDEIEPADQKTIDLYRRKEIATKNQHKILDYLRHGAVNEETSKQLFVEFLNTLGFETSQVNTLVGILDKHRAFHPAIEQRIWTSAIRDAIEEGPGEFETLCQYVIEATKHLTPKRIESSFEYYEPKYAARFTPYSLVR